jgi:hypothetical protein
MSKLEAVYSVIIKSGLPSREFELFKRLGCTVHNEQGEELIHFMCTSVDLSHHVYLEMEVFQPEDEFAHPLRVPHHYVLMISGAEGRKPIGFLAKLGDEV